VRERLRVGKLPSYALADHGTCPAGGFSAGARPPV